MVSKLWGEILQVEPLSLSLGFNEVTRCLKCGKGQKGWIYIGSMHVEKGLRYPKLKMILDCRWSFERKYWSLVAIIFKCSELDLERSVTAVIDCSRSHLDHWRTLISFKHLFGSINILSICLEILFSQRILKGFWVL